MNKEKAIKLELNKEVMEEALLEAIDGVTIEGDSKRTEEIRELLREDRDIFLEGLNEEAIIKNLKSHLVDDLATGLVDFLQEAVNRRETK